MTKELPIPLFVAQHHHRPEDCPAAPCRGMLLVSSVSAATAARYGVTIQAEAFFEQEHLLLLVVQAATPQAVHRFLACVPGPGQLRVLPARTAEEAVERGGCGPDLPPVPGDDPVTGGRDGVADRGATGHGAQHQSHADHNSEGEPDDVR